MQKCAPAPLIKHCIIRTSKNGFELALSLAYTLGMLKSTTYCSLLKLIFAAYLFLLIVRIPRIKLSYTVCQDIIKLITRPIRMPRPCLARAFTCTAHATHMHMSGLHNNISRHWLLRSECEPCSKYCVGRPDWCCSYCAIQNRTLFMDAQKVHEEEHIKIMIKKEPNKLHANSVW